MGFSWQYMNKIEQHGLVKNGTRLLDIGSSNLYGADVESLKNFIKQYNSGCSDEEATATAERLSAGSTYIPGKGGTNEAFLGEVIEAAGMEYWSFDIADGYRTEILDFNMRSLPGKHKNAWDLVLNFGTTEHVFNQLNSFKIIHEATKPGGAIFHQLPSVGYVDHCYFTYTARFFFDMAGFNEYRLLDFWYDGPGENNDINKSARNYKSYFPVLEDYLETVQAAKIGEIQCPDVSINVILQKVKDAPFVGAVESQTSVGAIPDEILKGYQK